MYDSDASVVKTLVLLVSVLARDVLYLWTLTGAPRLRSPECGTAVARATWQCRQTVSDYSQFGPTAKARSTGPFVFLVRVSYRATECR